jgi:pimeloyl-ACP methyl ester carboxylesterase
MFEDRYAVVDGIRTRYWQAGNDGPALVLIHGVASSIEDWADNLSALAQGFRVFALDLAGCGRSDKPAGRDYSLNGLAKFTLAFLDCLQIETAHLCGFSMGGRIALECAHIAPTRVLSLILSAPAAIGPDTIINFRIATLKGIGEVLTRPSRFGMRQLMRTAYADPTKVTDAMIDERVELGKLPGAQAAFLIMLRGLIRLKGFHPEIIADVQSWLPTIRQPTLVIWGKDDKFLPHRHAEILKRLMPDCRVKIYSNSGHLNQAEQKAAFNRDIMEFLQTQTIQTAAA